MRCGACFSLRSVAALRGLRKLKHAPRFPQNNFLAGRTLLAIAADTV